MPSCKCTLRETTVGDGCDICNPAKSLEYARDNLRTLIVHMRSWLAESALSERITAKRCREFLAILDDYDNYT